MLDDQESVKKQLSEVKERILVIARVEKCKEAAIRETKDLAQF